MINKIKVIKRNGEKEDLNPEKINKILSWASEGLTGVSGSDIAMNANLQFYNGIKTEDIHNVLIQSSVDLITEKTPNYQYVAGNLLNYLLRKQVFESKGNRMPSLYDVTLKNVNLGVYDKVILDNYTIEEFDQLNKYINHNRDYQFTYAGIQQLIDKYLVKNKTTGQIYETPQYAYMLIAMTVHTDKKDLEYRLKRIKGTYDRLSNKMISLPTPIISGIRTPNRQYSSCVLIETTDTLKSINATNWAVTEYVSKKAGIGLNVGALRAVGSSIRNGEIKHTGVVPFLKQLESSVHSCSQGGIRKGAATVYFPWWHKEIENVVILKNNKGTDDNRVRHLDYTIQMNRLFYRSFVNNTDVNLFSPHDAQELYEYFGDNDKFEEVYEKLSNDSSIEKKVVKARDLMNLIVQERIGTGRIYIHNIDSSNINSPFKDKIRMSNLCLEVLLPTTPVTSIYDVDHDPATQHLSEGEIALCVLAAFNVGVIKTPEEYMECAQDIIEIEDYIIENQDYPINAARKMLKRKSIGVGVINLAYWLAKNDLTYTDSGTLTKIDELFEMIQYSLLKASNNLAKEKGACEWFDRTTYSAGVLPIDRYNKNVDELVKRTYSFDWEKLRKDILRYGLRNSTVTNLMPSESSSVVSNATSGIDPIRGLVITKRAKNGSLKMVVPEVLKLKNKYQHAFDMKSNIGYLNICAVIQKWTDQSISANQFFEYTSDGISIGTVIKEILHAYKYGIKTLYYLNTDDKKSAIIEEEEDQFILPEIAEDDLGCESGACAI